MSRLDRVSGVLIVHRAPIRGRILTTALFVLLLAFISSACITVEGDSQATTQPSGVPATARDLADDGSAGHPDSAANTCAHT